MSLIKKFCLAILPFVVRLENKLYILLLLISHLFRIASVTIQRFFPIAFQALAVQLMLSFLVIS